MGLSEFNSHLNEIKKKIVGANTYFLGVGGLTLIFRTPYLKRHFKMPII